MSMATTFPRKSASLRGASTFSHVSFVSSGAGPRSGNEADVTALSTVSLVVVTAAQALNPKINPNNNNRFMYILLDAPILGKLSYEMITRG
jgi:hypothetical protein